MAKLERPHRARSDRSAPASSLPTPNDSTQTQLKKLADQKSLRQVVLGVINVNQLKSYKLHPDAECTVIFYDKQIVRANRAFKTGEFTLSGRG